MKAPDFAPDASGHFALPPADRAVEKLQRSARNAYELRHFSRALELYEQLSACGHARAAEIAGQMHLFGESLYGAAVRRDPMRAAVLLARAAQAGSPIAQHLLRQIDRTA
jgi:TPR repeat protein